MKNKLRYLALALLVSLGINAGTDCCGHSKKHSTTSVQLNDVKKTDDSSDSEDGGFFTGIIGSVSEIASTGVTGVETFVGNHKLAVAGGATVATVVAVYALYKWKVSADEVATLEDELEEANAIVA